MRSQPKGVPVTLSRRARPAGASTRTAGRDPRLPSKGRGAVAKDGVVRTGGPVEVPASPVRKEEPQRRVETPAPEEPPAPRRKESGRPARQRREPGWMKYFVRY